MSRKTKEAPAPKTQQEAEDPMHFTQVELPVIDDSLAKAEEVKKPKVKMYTCKHYRVDAEPCSARMRNCEFSERKDDFCFPIEVKGQ